MTQNWASWAWLLAIFPLWAVMAVLWFGLASVPKKSVGPGMCTLIDGTATGLSMCSAIAILLGLNCGSFISLPLTNQACHVLTFQLSSWVRL